MKKNVRFILKIAIISSLFILILAVRAFAAEVNMNNIDFTNIPESGTSSSNTTNNTANTANTTNKTNTTTNTTNKTNNTSTSSSSNTKMPATGSNIEIIFGVAIVTIVSGAIFFYRKQNIKLK